MVAAPLTDDAIRDIASMMEAEDLPGDLVDIALCIGVESSLRVARDLGAGRHYLRRWTESSERWSGTLRALVQSVGQEKAKAICDVFGGAHIDIPKCDGLWRSWRNRIIRQSKARQVDLARTWNLTDRQIRNIQRAANSAQTSLFDDL